jgi:5'-nucleotidase
MDEDSCPELALAIQNHFKAIEVRMGKKKHSRHRQSLISLSRRHSMIQMFDSIDLDGPSPMRRISISRMNSMDHSSSNFKMYRRASLDDLELESCQLAPSIQHRIIKIESEDVSFKKN